MAVDMTNEEYLRSEYKSMLTEVKNSFHLIKIQREEIKRLKSSNRSYLEIVVELGQELREKGKYL